MKKLLLLLQLILFSNSIAFSQWTELNSVTDNSLLSISSPNNNTIWTGSYSGLILKSTNGGASWSNLYLPDFNMQPLYSVPYVYALDSTTVFAVGVAFYTTLVYKTSDGGKSWNIVFSQIDGGINGIYFTSPTEGIMVGNPVGNRWSIWKTTDTGNSWDSTGLCLLVPPPASTGYGFSNSFFVDKNNTVWFGANGNIIYCSTTNGSNWQYQTTDNEEHSTVSAIWFNTSGVGISGARNGSIFRTTNGNTWDPVIVPGNTFINGIVSINNNWWIIRDDNNIYNSSDNGITWKIQYDAPIGKYTRITKSRNGNILWAIRDNGGISRMDQSTNIDPNANQIPNEMVLEQNYPNPFNPETQIKFSLSMPSIVSLKIYDVTGREVSVLVNELSFGAGNFTQTFNGNGLRSGIYFYSLIVNGITFSTRKMILIK